MTFTNAARNFTLLMVVAFVLLIVDLYKWQTGKQTWSESIWAVNQKTLAVSFGVGVVCGHLFTVPRGGISMPEPEIKQLPSIWGYINWRELRNIVIASNVLQALLDSVIIPILQNHSLWLSEPWSSRVAPFIALIIALLSGREFGRRMIRQGE